MDDIQQQSDNVENEISADTGVLASEIDGDDDGDVGAAPALPQSELEALAAKIEALLFVSSRPMAARRLGELLGHTSVTPIRQACDWLAAQYVGRAFQLVRLAGGYQLQSRPEFEEVVLKLQRQRKAQKLTPGALETLAIVAYKQPITRNELDAIRGVSSDHHVRTLSERNLIRITGRQPVTQGMGAALYGTTVEFLNAFGLRSISQLPTQADLGMTSTSGENADDGQSDDEDPSEEVALEVIEVRHADGK